MAALKEEEESLHSITHSGIQKSKYNLVMRSKLNISPSITKASDEKVYKTELVIQPYSSKSISIFKQRKSNRGYQQIYRRNI